MQQWLCSQPLVRLYVSVLLREDQRAGREVGRSVVRDDRQRVLGARLKVPHLVGQVDLGIPGVHEGLGPHDVATAHASRRIVHQHRVVGVRPREVGATRQSRVASDAEGAVVVGVLRLEGHEELLEDGLDLRCPILERVREPHGEQGDLRRAEGCRDLVHRGAGPLLGLLALDERAEARRPDGLVHRGPVAAAADEDRRTRVLDRRVCVRVEVRPRVGVVVGDAIAAGVLLDQQELRPVAEVLVADGVDVPDGDVEGNTGGVGLAASAVEHVPIPSRLEGPLVRRRGTRTGLREGASERAAAGRGVAARQGLGGAADEDHRRADLIHVPAVPDTGEVVRRDLARVECCRARRDADVLQHAIQRDRSRLGTGCPGGHGQRADLALPAVPREEPERPVGLAVPDEPAALDGADADDLLVVGGPAVGKRRREAEDVAHAGLVDHAPPRHDLAEVAVPGPARDLQRAVGLADRPVVGARLPQVRVDAVAEPLPERRGRLGNAQVAEHGERAVDRHLQMPVVVHGHVDVGPAVLRPHEDGTGHARHHAADDGRIQTRDLRVQRGLGELGLVEEVGLRRTCRVVEVVADVVAEHGSRVELVAAGGDVGDGQRPDQVRTARVRVVFGTDGAVAVGVDDRAELGVAPAVEDARRECRPVSEVGRGLEGRESCQFWKVSHTMLHSVVLNFKVTEA